MYPVLHWKGGRSLHTVSLKMARRLKQAKLLWEPKLGDWYCFPNGKPNVVSFKPGAGNEFVRISYDGYDRFMTLKELYAEQAIWLPTLSDLLTWLEERGVRPVSTATRLILFINCKGVWTRAATFPAKKREDAAAMAVLWLLEKEARSSGGKGPCCA